MVSIWPWRGDDDSPASFEKTLSNLSTKITRTTARLDNFRQRSRRYNTLWIFYSTIVYLLYAIILLLVVGWRNWGLVEIGAIVLGPILIYSVRLGIVSYYNFRISKNQAQLDEVKKERDKVIEKLKTATKYNTTQELLQKYGGAPAPRNKSDGASQGKSNAAKGNPGASQVRRTGILPPPTANISRQAGPAPVLNNGDVSASGSSGSYRLPPSLSAESSPNRFQAPSSPQVETAEFAPNAFSAVPQYAQSNKGPRWIDRLMDVILGEDESLPSNRIALICKQCRLVNGQAPPGVKRLDEVGKWRCAECGTMNGEETEVKKILAVLNDEPRNQNHQTAQKRRSPNPNSNPNPTDENHHSHSDTSERRREDKAEPQTNEEVIGAVADSDESDITQYSDASNPYLDRDRDRDPGPGPDPGINPKQQQHPDASPTAEPPLRRRPGRPSRKGKGKE